jgi:hypothetical protein
MSDEHANPDASRDPAVEHHGAGAAAGSDHATAAIDHSAPPHGTAHDAGHGHDDMGLGPIDWTAWFVGLVGAAAGVALVVCAALSTGAL